MKSKTKNDRFDGAYKIRMATCVIFFIIFACGLIFFVRIFEKFGKTAIVRVESIGNATRKNTYIVNEKEYYYYSGNPSDILQIGDYIHYQISNPSYAVTDRNIWLIAFFVTDAIILGLIIGLTIYEFKKRR